MSAATPIDPNVFRDIKSIDADPFIAQSVQDTHTSREIEEFEARETVDRLLTLITDQQLEIVHRLYGRGMSAEKAAADMGIPRQTLCYQRDKALATMREAMAS